MRIEQEIDIAAAPERVYETVMDPHRLDEWVTIHVGLADAPDGELRKGSQLTQLLKLAGRRFSVRWTVVEDECPRHVVWEGRGPVRSRARVVYQLDAIEQGTRFGYSNEYSAPGGPLARIAERALARISTRETERSLARLKAIVEG